MHLHTHQPLKPLNLAEQAGRPSMAKVRTNLMAADLHGRVSHALSDAAAYSSNGKRPLLAHGVAAGGAEPTHQDQLVEQTRKWVAQTFFGTLMKQMHQSPFKSKMMDGGRGGEAFTEMRDQRLIEHMSRGAGRKLVNAVVHKIESREKAAKAYAQQANAPSGGGGQRSGGSPSGTPNRSGGSLGGNDPRRPKFNTASGGVVHSS